MYVFGGSLYPTETITAELWKLDLTTLQWTPLFNQSSSPPPDNSSSPFPSTPVYPAPLEPPVPVRGHTAHVVGSKMLVLLGYSSAEEPFPSYVQEYDFGETRVVPMLLVIFVSVQALGSGL